MQVLSDTNLGWLNLPGSGNETASYLRVFNRITMMFSAFDGEVMILRRYGKAQVRNSLDVVWDAAIAAFPKMAVSRQVFDMTIDSDIISSGTGLLVMSSQFDRVTEELLPFFEDFGLLAPKISVPQEPRYN